MGLFNATAFLKGAAQEGLNMFNKAEAIGEEGIENLKAAREEVNAEIKTMKDTYNKAIQIGDNVGGGAFAKYLFNTQDISYLAGLANETQETRTGELSTLKKNFEALSEEEKAKFSDGDFSETVKADYDREVEALKVNSGLVNTNNLGVATANTLGGKVQQMVDRQFEPRRQAIIDTVGGGQLKESTPIQGGFASIPSLKTGVVDFNAAGPDMFTTKSSVNKQFEDYLKSNRFKVEGTNMYLSGEALQEFGNVIGIDYDRIYTQQDVIDTDMDPQYVNKKGETIIKEMINSAVEELGKRVDEQGNPAPVRVTQEFIIEDVLKQNFVNKNYGDIFNYVGILNVLNSLDPADE